VVHLLSDMSQTTSLLSIGVPYICRMPRFRSIMYSEIMIIEGVDIDANMFAHQANTERVSEATDFEWLSAHFSGRPRQIHVATVAKII
jgi:hypothetical protein